MRSCSDIRYRFLACGENHDGTSLCSTGSLLEEPYAGNLHVRVREGPGQVTALVYSESHMTYMKDAPLRARCRQKSGDPVRNFGTAKTGMELTASLSDESGANRDESSRSNPRWVKRQNPILAAMGNRSSRERREGGYPARSSAAMREPSQM